MAFRGLQAESARQGDAHKAIAKELISLVADPFEDWAEGHKVCLAKALSNEVILTHHIV